jgi:TPR repeat protein
VTNAKILIVVAFLVSAPVFGQAQEEAQPAPQAQSQTGGQVQSIGDLSNQAGQGDPEAQYRLAMMYQLGRVIPQDYKKAASWFERAALQGNTDAQFGLGVLCYNGKGVEVDLVKAHMWFNVSAAGGNEAAVKYRELVTSKLTEKEIDEAQELASNWAPKPE